MKKILLLTLFVVVLVGVYFIKKYKEQKKSEVITTLNEMVPDIDTAFDPVPTITPYTNRVDTPVLTDAPAKLQALSKANLAKVALQWRTGMQKEDYTHWSDSSQMEVIAAYGILFQGNYAEKSFTEVYKDGSGPSYYSFKGTEYQRWSAWCEKSNMIGFRKSFINKVYSSRTMQTLTYEWQKDALVKMFVEMKQNDQKRFKMFQYAMTHIMEYVKHFNLQNEQKTLLKDKQNFTVREGNPWRKLECWVFRRIDKGQMTSEDITYWLNTAKKDFGL